MSAPFSSDHTRRTAPIPGAHEHPGGERPHAPAADEVRAACPDAAYPAVGWYEDGVLRVHQLSGLTRIGRSLNANIRFEDVHTSRRHALIFCEHGQAVRICDDHSMNGIWVNGQRVGTSEGVCLQTGDIIRVGKTYLTFSAAENAR